MRQVSVGGEGMDGWEGRAGGMVRRRGGVAGGWRSEKSIRIVQGTGKSSVGRSQLKEKELLPVLVAQEMC